MRSRLFGFAIPLVRARARIDRNFIEYDYEYRRTPEYEYENAEILDL